MDLQSSIGKDVYAKVQLGVWALPQTNLNNADFTKLSKTLYPGDYIGKIAGVQMLGSDPWFALAGGGYIHALDSNLTFNQGEAKAGFGWAGWVILALIAGGAYVEYNRKKKNT